MEKGASSAFFIVIPKPPPWAVVIEPWGYCPNECPC
ncbi:rfbP protein [Vibrio aestuarianus]|nr:rfbP protein [Vibrio aestuarianus]